MDFTFFENRLSYSKVDVQGESGNTEEHHLWNLGATPKHKIPNLLSQIFLIHLSFHHIYFFPRRPLSSIPPNNEQELSIYSKRQKSA